MTSSARDRAIEALAARVDSAAGTAVQRWAWKDLKQIAADLRALAGEVPAPAGDAPPLWWSPQFGPIEESKDRHTAARYIGFSRQSFTWVNLGELPADAVPLVPAGGSAPHQGATTDAAAVLAELRAPLTTIESRHTPDARMGHDDVRCMSCQEESWPCVTEQALEVVRALLGAATTTAPEA